MMTVMAEQIGKYRHVSLPRRKGNTRWFLKRLTARQERRRAKKDPENSPKVRRYSGWAD